MSYFTHSEDAASPFFKVQGWVNKQMPHVLDAADQTIVVYANGMPITRFGGIGSVPGRFVQATSIDADENLVYVADAGNARVQLLLAAPESMRPR